MVRVSISAWYFFSSTLQSLDLEVNFYVMHSQRSQAGYITLGESEDRPLSLG